MAKKQTNTYRLRILKSHKGVENILEAWKVIGHWQHEECYFGRPMPNRVAEITERYEEYRNG